MASQAGSDVGDLADRLNALAVREIRIFLEAYPLGPSPSSVPDQNTRTPNLIYGTAILPLWRQTTELRAGSEHWPAFTRLLDALKPFIWTTSVMFSISHPEEFQRAKTIKARRLAAQDPALAIPESTAENCFETMRLSANIAPGRCLLQTTHPSKLACLITVGLGLSSGGNIAIPALGLQFTAKPGDFRALSTAMEVYTQPFSGERYELQFFVPDSESEYQEGVSGVNQ